MRKMNDIGIDFVKKLLL